MKFIYDNIIKLNEFVMASLKNINDVFKKSLIREKKK